MTTYPLASMSVAEAMQKQFDLVDIITKHLSGSESLTLGDLGVNMQGNKPLRTAKVEKIIADFFSAEACMLTRGAGTQAICRGLQSAVKHGETILVHTAPIYPTTEVTLTSMGLHIVRANFNNAESVLHALDDKDIKLCLIQHTRQDIADSYNLEDIITLIKNKSPQTIILADDNYAVMKVPHIGCECGADLSAFSLFKLLGPVGIGCLVGKKELVDKASACNYSGGGQVQGFESMEALHGLVYAPVALAIQAEQNEILLAELNDRNKFPYIKSAFLANAQSKVLLVEFMQPVAADILAAAEKAGALPNPVGAESKFEITPLFYRVSGTFLKKDPSLKEKMIRINPNRSGAKTVIRILKEAYKSIEK